MNLSEFAERNVAVKSSDAYKRISSLFDEGSFNEIDAFSAAGVICGFGTVCGVPAYSFSQNKEVIGGAVGRAEAAKIKKIYDLAAKTGAPVVGIYDSNGAKLAEGSEALAAYGDMLLWANNISGVVPQISVIAGTCAGTAAMVACGADVVVMAENAELFMTAPAVLRASENWTDEIGTADVCLKAGVVHLTAPDDMAAVMSAKDILSRLPMNNLSDAPAFDFAPSGAVAEDSDPAAVIASVADAGSLVELGAEYGTNAYTALGMLEGGSVGFVGVGNDIYCDEASKIAHFVRLCDSFSIPVITVVNTHGFEKSILAENGGVIKYASMLSHAYAEATTVKLALVSGNAFGAAYIACAGKNANADMVMAWDSAVISALEPEAAVSILMNERLAAGESREELVKEYCEVNACAVAAAEAGQVDDVFTPGETRAKLSAALNVMSGKRVSRLPKKHSNMPL